jgi:hypothetical protein
MIPATIQQILPQSAELAQAQPAAKIQFSAMIFVSAAPLLSATKSGMVGTAKLT